MSKKNNKQNVIETATETATALATQVAPATEVSIDSIAGPVASVRARFEEDGETLRLREGVEVPTSEEFAMLIEDFMCGAAKAVSHSGYVLYEAKKAGELVFSNTVNALRYDGMSDSALANLKSIATRVIPAKVRLGYKQPVSLLKDAVASILDPKDEKKTRTTPLAIALQKAFVDNANPQGLMVPNAKGKFEDKGGQPLTLASVRAIMAMYDKEGNLKTKPEPEAPTPVLTTEQRSATAANATGEPATAASEQEAVVNAAGGTKPELQSLVTEKTPVSAGSSPETSGTPTPKGASMTEGEMIVAAAEAVRNRMTAYSANHAWKTDERSSLLAVASFIAKHFGAEVIE